MKTKRTYDAIERSLQATVPVGTRSVSRTLVSPGPSTSPGISWGIELFVYLLFAFIFFFLQATLAGSALAAPPPAVTVSAVTEKEVNPPAEFVGRIEAVQSVDLRAIVQGYLKEAHY